MIRKYAGVKEVVVNLIASEHSLDLHPRSAHATASIASLRERFAQLLEAERLQSVELATAVAVFIYTGGCTSADTCYVSVRTQQGKLIDAAVSENRGAPTIVARQRLKATRALMM